MEEHLHQALAELEENLSNLKGYIEYIEQAKENSKKISEAAESVVETLKKVQEEYGKLESAVDKLIEIIDKVDFPKRLDKLDVTVSTINQNISTLQNRLEKIYNEIDKSVQNNKSLLEGADLKHEKSTAKIISTVNEVYSELNQKLNSLGNCSKSILKQNDFLKGFSIISAIIIIGLLLAVVYKIYFV